MKRFFWLVSIVLIMGSPLYADAGVIHPKKITSTVNVYHWDRGKGVWYEERLIKTYIEIFDVDGKLVRKDLTDGKDGLLERTLLTYNGNTITKQFVNEKNELLRSAVVTIQGNTHREVVRRPDNSLMFQFVTEHDERGRITTIEHLDSSGKLVFKKYHEYDTEGNCISIQNKNPDGSVAVVISYEYVKFDKNGNWLSRKESLTYGDVHRRPHEQVHRTIEQERS